MHALKSYFIIHVQPLLVISVNTLTASSEVTEIDLQFPVSHDLVNFSVNYIPVVSRVPPEFVNSLLDAQNENNSEFTCDFRY